MNILFTCKIFEETALFQVFYVLIDMLGVKLEMQHA